MAVKFPLLTISEGTRPPNEEFFDGFLDTHKHTMSNRHGKKIGFGVLDDSEDESTSEAGSTHADAITDDVAVAAKVTSAEREAANELNIHCIEAAMLAVYEVSGFDLWTCKEKEASKDQLEPKYKYIFKDAKGHSEEEALRRAQKRLPFFAALQKVLKQRFDVSMIDRGECVEFIFMEMWIEGTAAEWREKKVEIIQAFLRQYEKVFGEWNDDVDTVDYRLKAWLYKVDALVHMIQEVLPTVDRGMATAMDGSLKGLVGALLGDVNERFQKYVQLTVPPTFRLQNKLEFEFNIVRHSMKELWADFHKMKKVAFKEVILTSSDVPYGFHVLESFGTKTCNLLVQRAEEAKRSAAVRGGGKTAGKEPSPPPPTLKEIALLNPNKLDGKKLDGKKLDSVIKNIVLCCRNAISHGNYVLIATSKHITFYNVAPLKTSTRTLTVFDVDAEDLLGFLVAVFNNIRDGITATKSVRDWPFRDRYMRALTNALCCPKGSAETESETAAAEDTAPAKAGAGC